MRRERERERVQTSFIVRSTLADSPGSGGGTVCVDTTGRLGAGVQHAVNEGVALNINKLQSSALKAPVQWECFKYFNGTSHSYNNYKVDCSQSESKTLGYKKT